MSATGSLPLLLTDTFWDLVGHDVAAISDRFEPIVVTKGMTLDDETISRLAISCLSGDSYPGRVLDIIVPTMDATNLQWLHTFSAGVDSPVFATLMDRGVRLTNSSGASAPSIARTVIMMLLALSRDLPGWMRAQADHRWDPRRFDEVIGQRMVVVGWGPIGQEVARLSAALGLEISVVRRSARGDEPHRVVPLDRLAEAARDADWMVLALPLTPGTRGVLSAEVLAGMPSSARLINVGRGELVDEAALIGALGSGALAGAGLDVFATEPLPADSELWTLPNVIVTPHCSGVTDHTDARGTALFLENLAAFAVGRPMRNEITR